MTADKTFLGLCFTRHQLTALECEIVAALILSRLALLSARGCKAVVEALNLDCGRTMAATRAISEHGRLSRAGLVSIDNPEADFEDRVAHVSDSFFASVVSGRNLMGRGLPVRTEDEMYKHFGQFTGTLRKIKDMSNQYYRSSFGGQERINCRRRVNSLLSGLEETLRQHKDWKLSVFRKHHQLGQKEWTIFLALLGKELGHVEATDDMFLGRGLAQIVSTHDFEMTLHLDLLKSDGTLIARQIVRPCGGRDETLRNDSSEIAETEFELTPNSCSALELEKRNRKRTDRRSGARDPVIRLSQLALGEEVHQALGMAMTHARNAKTLTQTWGLGEMIPYGRSVTLLFSGPPGTGKTACAEALAFELEKQILVANYAEIQSCWVGESEKNIVRVFNEARKKNAVLFWDEADAMFFDRDTASRTWEVRDVNVLLQELERYEGVCVLATNRKITLDKALERRITLKVEFNRPDRAMRRQIWTKIIPPKLPMTADVDMDRLSAEELSGGEIKNVVLNAARLALEEHPKGPVRMRHFLKAVEMETRGKWSEGGGPVIGFGQPGRFRSAPGVSCRAGCGGSGR